MRTRNATIGIDHTIQMAHRLWSLPGKCTQLHGHTWNVALMIDGPRDEHGIVLDYHELKHEFRAFLDNNFDHKLCLADQDPLITRQPMEPSRDFEERLARCYPGLVSVPFLPSTENLAEYWASYAKEIWGQGPKKYIFTVSVTEGDLNHATITLD